MAIAASTIYHNALQEGYIVGHARSGALWLEQETVGWWKATAAKDCARASLFVEEVQGSLWRGPGKLIHPRSDTLVQIPQPIMK